MNEEIYTDIVTRLDALGEKLGVASGQVWEILVRQQYAEAMTEAAWGVFFFGMVGLTWYLSVLFLRWGKAEAARIEYEKERHQYYHREGDEQANTIGWVIRVVGCGFFLLVSLSWFTSAVKMLINPEYYALKEILRVVG